MLFHEKEAEETVEFQVCYMQTPTEIGADPSARQDPWDNKSASLRENSPIEGTDTDRELSKNQDGYFYTWQKESLSTSD